MTPYCVTGQSRESRKYDASINHNCEINCVITLSRSRARVANQLLQLIAGFVAPLRGVCGAVTHAYLFIFALFLSFAHIIPYYYVASRVRATLENAINVARENPTRDSANHKSIPRREISSDSAIEWADSFFPAMRASSSIKVTCKFHQYHPRARARVQFDALNSADRAANCRLN